MQMYGYYVSERRVEKQITPLCLPYSENNTLEGADQLKIDH